MERQYEEMERSHTSPNTESGDESRTLIENDHRREKRYRVIGILALYSTIVAGAVIADRVYRYFQPKH